MQEWQMTARVLAMTRADLSISQPQRVEELLAHGDPDRVIDEHLTSLVFETDDSSALIQKWLAAGIEITTILQDSYPQTLRGIREAPAILFSTGAMRRYEKGVSIVGSRDASTSALAAAADVSRAIAAEGVAVISGLAAGVDTAAHQAALDVGGRTVAFMGTGVNHVYPAQNRELRVAIEKAGGAIYSQFLPDERGSKRSFPMRNAVMSGYGAATIVIAASERSGTRHQVAAAVRHGRDVIFSGRVADETSWGRELVSRGKAQAARSTDEAIALALRATAQASEELTLFA